MPSLIDPKHLKGLFLFASLLSHTVAQSLPTWQINFTLENDNPFLNLFPDVVIQRNDHGYTHGLNAEIRFRPTEGLFSDQEQWRFLADTKLYTMDLTPKNQDVFPHEPQLFNELTTWQLFWSHREVSTSDWREQLELGIGLGKKNTDDDSGLGGVGQQKRWHDFKHHELTPETTALYDNQPREHRRYYGLIDASYAWVHDWKKGSDKRYDTIDTVTFRNLIRLSDYLPANYLKLHMQVEQGFARWYSQRLSTSLTTQLAMHAKGEVNWMITPAVQFYHAYFSVSTGINRYFGEKNTALTEFEDPNNIWFMTLSTYW